MGQSILRDTVIRFKSGLWLYSPAISKGKQVNIPAPNDGYWAATQTNSKTLAKVLTRVLFSC